MRTTKRIVPAFLLIVILSGCWDRNEINDYAFWIGSALDLTKDGEIQTSAQIAIPSQFIKQKGGGGASGRSNIVVSATGKSLVDLINNLQEKLPRRIFIGHRRAIFFGEKLARRGIKNIVDQFSRNSDTRLRTDIFVVQDAEGKDALEINSPFSHFSAIAAVDQDRFCRIGDVALRDFFLDATSQGIRPIMPVIKLSPQKQDMGKIFLIASLAIFNKDLKMAGFLEREETMQSLWVKGILKDEYLTHSIDNGRYSLYVSNLKSTIITHINQDKITAEVQLSGKGRILESQSNADLSKPEILMDINRKLNKKEKVKIEKTIKIVQEKYGQDIFGFGEALHRQHPYQWKSLKDNWDQIFPNMPVTVHLDIRIMRVGNLGKQLIE
ncbi:Ger(x)C family spore germination protein [Paenibacillus sp. Soil787]|uniref:Ger(x)C family spore germination protein n=1 Tax=Paenibacillus sp. Soil787 TaxID=1736411 RepID=UPI0006F582C9|nr:Ger(x)C family spore germination protein [Paenibacillus sp. Soil787]KRF42221.1 hypothetical protein ASG93_21215 [Paenibacillus sp. Soil787]